MCGVDCLCNDYNGTDFVTSPRANAQSQVPSGAAVGNQINTSSCTHLRAYFRSHRGFFFCFLFSSIVCVSTLCARRSALTCSAPNAEQAAWETLTICMRGYTRGCGTLRRSENTPGAKQHFFEASETSISRWGHVHGPHSASAQICPRRPHYVGSFGAFEPASGRRRKAA